MLKLEPIVRIKLEKSLDTQQVKCFLSINPHLHNLKIKTEKILFRGKSYVLCRLCQEPYSHSDNEVSDIHVRLY